MTLREQIYDASSFANHFLGVNAIVTIEEYTVERFGNPLCSSVTNDHTITFNKAWIDAGKLDSDDIPFFLIHELRHIYQLEQINNFKSERAVLESPSTLKKWAYEWSHYCYNLGDPVSRKKNISQEIEMDANGYSMALLILKHINESWSPMIRMEEDQFDMAIARAQFYIQTRPELQQWVQKNYRG
ncbi:MAG: hypothetical protein J6D53_15005 [Blautia sp.]|nr:hypothetical protein [Lachnospiraceae bacterium]MBP3902741.1 hypothetical protein [Blautia sp.]